MPITMNFREWFEEKVDLGKDFPCIWWEDQMLTYEQVNANVNRAANAMYKLGIRKGTKVAIVMTNCPEFIYCWFGLAKIGAISLFVNADMKDEGLRYLLSSGDAEAVIISKSRWQNYLAIRESLPGISNAICVPDLEGLNSAGKAISFKQIYAASSSRAPADTAVDNGEPMGFIHTAGTTGPPKWAILSHKAYINSAEHAREWTMTTHKDIFFNPLPLFHINPQSYFLMNALAGNASVVIVDRYSASRLWHQVCHYKATLLCLHIAPLIYQLKQPIVPEETAHQVRMIIIGAHQAFMERFKIPVGGCVYGSTELSGFVTTNRFYLPLQYKWEQFGDTLYKITGKPMDYVEVKIFDQNDNEVPIGGVGEIVARGKEPHVIFDGYYKMPEKNREAFRSGWFHTGDAGKIDEDGNLWFEERLADSINVKGEWIPAELVESAIRSYPHVVDVAVIGVPDEDGTAIKACVQIAEGFTAEPVKLLDFCQTKVARFMLPRYIEFVREFPRTFGTEKIQKKLLKDRGVGSAWDREKAGYVLKRD